MSNSAHQRALMKSPHNRDNAERDAKILRLWRDRASNGLTIADLKRRFGVSFTTVKRIIEQAGGE